MASDSCNDPSIKARRSVIPFKPLPLVCCCPWVLDWIDTGNPCPSSCTVIVMMLEDTVKEIIHALAWLCLTMFVTASLIHILMMFCMREDI
ncbi:hypothetical protein D3C75_952380 [compost metagenome]